MGSIFIVDVVSHGGFERIEILSDILESLLDP